MSKPDCTQWPHVPESILGSPVYPGLGDALKKLGAWGADQISVSAWPSGNFLTGSLGQAWAAIHDWEDQSAPFRPLSG